MDEFQAPNAVEDLNKLLTFMADESGHRYRVKAVGVTERTLPDGATDYGGSPKQRRHRLGT
jgi:hypothetical protein